MADGGVPSLFLMAEDADPLPAGLCSFHIFFFLSFLAGAVQAPKALENKPNKYICIRLVGMDPPGHTLSMVLFYHLSEFVLFPALHHCGRDPVWMQLGTDSLHGDFLPCLPPDGEALQLLIYRKTGRVLTTS